MSKEYLRVNIRYEGIREILRAMDSLPKNVQDGIRDESKKLAESLAEKIRADGVADAAPQSPLVAKTVRAVRDRTPSITVGGSRRLGRRKVPAYKLLFGSVFGSDAHQQFHRPHNGQEGYWIYPTVDRNSAEIIAAWNKVADDAISRWAAG